MESWNLNHLYKDNESWLKDTKTLEGKLHSLESQELILTKENLEAFLRDLTDAYELVEHIYIYPRRLLDLKDNDEVAKDMMNKSINLYNDYLKVEGKFKNTIVENKDIITKIITKDNYWYRYLSIILRKGNHLANIDILADYNKEFPNIRSEYLKLINEGISFADVDINGEVVKITKKNYNKLLEDEESENRSKVFSSFMQGYANITNQIWSLYLQKLKLDIKLYKSEGYESLLEKKLFELELNPDTLNNLIKKIKGHVDLMHEYQKLKKEMSGLSEFHTYDNSMISTKISQKLEFLDSVNLVKEALSPLGSEYLNLIDKAVEEGWIEVYPSEHKRSNTSTSICYNGVPYILLNYTKNMIGARNLAHELGHAIHVYYSVKNNKMEYFEFDLFLTEIISKVNEILFNEYLIKASNDNIVKKDALNNILSSLSNSLFNQMLLTEFEHKVITSLENKESIDVEDLNNIYYELLKEYNGPSLTLDELNKYGWALNTHLVWQDSYYLYQYSIGLALGVSIALKILNKELSLEKYQELLSVGRSKSIIDALSLVDIDINDENYLDDVLNYFNDKIAMIKKL